MKLQRMKYILPLLAVCFLATIAVTVSLANANNDETPVRIGSSDTLIFSDDFEGGLTQPRWITLDENGTTDGDYKWGHEHYTFTQSSGDISVWAVGAGINGDTLTPVTDGYPDNTQSWLILNEPVDFTNVINPKLRFSYFYQMDSGNQFTVMASKTGSDISDFTDQLMSVNGGSADSSTILLMDSSYEGESEVYLAFAFHSDNSGNPTNKLGAFIDDVEIWGTNPTHIHLPVVIKNIPPVFGGLHRYDFDGSSTEWAMRRTDIADTDDWSVYLEDEYLYSQIASASDYLLVAPMDAAPTDKSAYELEARFDLTNNIYDEHSYGIVFGADANNTDCPNTAFDNCFNRFYWFHVRYRENDGDPKFEIQLKKVTEFNDSNAPIVDIIYGWVNPEDLGISLDPKGWNTWRVEIETDNQIDIFVNNVSIVPNIDIDGLVDELADNPYFGIISSVSAQGDMTSRVDYFAVQEPTEAFSDNVNE